MHFFLILPEERFQLRSQPVLYLIYLPAFVTLVLFPIIGYAKGQPLLGFHTFRIIETGVAFFMAAIIALVNFFIARSQHTRQQMQIVLVSCVVAIVPILLLNLLPQAIRTQPIVSPGFSILPFAFIPIGMGYAIITQKLMDIDVVIRRGIVYGLVTVVMATIVSGAFFIMGAARPLVNVGQEIATDRGGSGSHSYVIVRSGKKGNRSPGRQVSFTRTATTTEKQFRHWQRRSAHRENSRICPG